jgi:hypothetical protein
MSKTIHIFLIHSKHLTHRSGRFQNTLRSINDIAKNNNYMVKTQIILQHEPDEIQSKIEDLNKKVSYDPINDDDFDKQRYMLSVQLISNIEKHKEAWSRIQNMPNNSQDLYLIIEDDAILFPECVHYFDELLNYIDINETQKRGDILNEMKKCKLEIKNRRLQNKLIKSIDTNVVKVKSPKKIKRFC